MNNQKTIIELEAQISALKKQLKNIAQESKKKEEKLTSQINELKEENNNLMNLLKLSKKKMYGASAEKVAQAYGQISLFNEAEQERTVLIPEPQIEEVVIPEHTRKKKRNYDEIYKDLPVEEVVYDIPEEAKNCSKCGEPLTFLKYETRREIKMIPAQVKVVEHKKAVYVCKNCDKTGTEGTFVAAEAPKPLIEKSLVSASMLSEIINQKYCMGVPLYRLESYFKNMQINLTRQTMANWIISASNLTKPIYDEMKKELVSARIIHADETELEVLAEPERRPQTKSYMWVYTTGKSADKNIILYDYKEGRSGKYAAEFLKGFTGYVHCDGWNGYNKVENIILAGVKEANTINVSNVTTSTLTKKVSNFELTEKEEAVVSKNSNIFNTQNILTEEKSIDETQLNENIKEHNEKYYYDYNTKELSYMLTTYIETPNQTIEGEIIKVVIE